MAVSAAPPPPNNLTRIAAPAVAGLDAVACAIRLRGYQREWRSETSQRGGKLASASVFRAVLILMTLSDEINAESAIPREAEAGMGRTARNRSSDSDQAPHWS